jgi:hypothetical protein
MAVGFSSSAVASDSGITVNPFGTAKLFYESISNDAANSTDLFDKKGALGQARISGGATGAINNCLGYGFEYMAVDTLGLENNLVSNTAMGYGRESAARYPDGGVAPLVETQHWASQAYLTYSPCDTVLSNTTFKIGRQYLDTPLAFTENWKIAPNSFDAAVVVNKDIVNTTLVAAYVGKGNGIKGRVTSGDDFQSYVNEGAYAVGAITSLLDGALPISVWGYDVGHVANAVWADAGYNVAVAEGTKLALGGQFANMMPADALGASAEDTTGYGVKVGTNISLGDMNFGLLGAYSSVDEGTLPVANTATGFKKTKLYTAGIYTDGLYVAQPDSDAYKIKATTKLAGIGSLAIQYINNENETTPALDVSEIDVILGTTLPGGIGAKLIYMNRDHDLDDNGARDTDHVRVVLAKKF